MEWLSRSVQLRGLRTGRGSGSYHPRLLRPLAHGVSVSPPSSGRPDMRPTTRFLGLRGCKRASSRRYSRKASRSGAKNGMVSMNPSSWWHQTEIADLAFALRRTPAGPRQRRDPPRRRRVRDRERRTGAYRRRDRGTARTELSRAGSSAIARGRVRRDGAKSRGAR